jgi:hypothetical protein
LKTTVDKNIIEVKNTLYTAESDPPLPREKTIVTTTVP